MDFDGDWVLEADDSPFFLLNASRISLSSADKMLRSAISELERFLFVRGRRGYQRAEKNSNSVEAERLSGRIVFILFSIRMRSSGAKEPLSTAVGTDTPIIKAIFSR